MKYIYSFKQFGYEKKRNKKIHDAYEDACVEGDSRFRLAFMAPNAYHRLMHSFELLKINRNK